MVKAKSASQRARPRWILDTVLMPERRPRGRDRAQRPPETATIDGLKFQLSDVFRVFFPFVSERHAIFKRRLAGEPKPWTDDPILGQYPFTNMFRILDRNSQYILRNVIRKGSQDLNDMFFRVLLFRTFNKIETWEILEKKLGPLTWDSFNVAKYERALSSVKGALYNAAYIIPSPKLGYEKNHQNHLRMIETMMAVDRLPEELAKLKHLKDVHGRIQMYSSMGDFMAMQSVVISALYVSSLIAVLINFLSQACTGPQHDAALPLERRRMGSARSRFASMSPQNVRSGDSRPRSLRHPVYSRQPALMVHSLWNRTREGSPPTPIKTTGPDDGRHRACAV